METLFYKKKSKFKKILFYHFNQLLKIPGELDEAKKNKIVQRPPFAFLDGP